MKIETNTENFLRQNIVEEVHEFPEIQPNIELSILEQFHENHRKLTRKRFVIKLFQYAAILIVVFLGGIFFEKSLNGLKQNSTLARQEYTGKSKNENVSSLKLQEKPILFLQPKKRVTPKIVVVFKPKKYSSNFNDEKNKYSKQFSIDDQFELPSISDNMKNQSILIGGKYVNTKVQESEFQHTQKIIQQLKFVSL